MKTDPKLILCGRCHAKMECFSSDIAHCACNEVKIDSSTVNFLKQTEYGCLCNKCLVEMDGLVQKAKQYNFPERRDEMIEGIHYYVENGYFVFTTLYHILRGKCCQSGCRHCAYGFKNN